MVVSNKGMKNEDRVGHAVGPGLPSARAMQWPILLPVGKPASRVLT